MLRESFVLLPRVGRRTEKRLWGQGIRDWNSFIAAPSISGFSRRVKEAHDRLLSVARERLIAGDSAFFAPLLSPSEHWRLYQEFRDEACFLDIETGMRNEVTVVGMAMGDQCYTLLRGSTLDKEAIQRLLSRAKILVTFNGRSFDVPALEKYFGLGIEIPHVDLRHACAAVGLTGGLKRIEQEMGIARRAELSVLRGARSLQDGSRAHGPGSVAPKLWNAYRATGDEYYLDILVKYNEEDCVNLQAVADRVVPRLWDVVRRGSKDGIQPQFHHV